MLFTNLVLPETGENTCLRVENGTFTAIAKDLAPLPGEEARDCGGKLALPQIGRAHV